MQNKEVHQFIKWFSELSNKDIKIAGGKGASLAEMYNLKMPIPPGFIITAQAYKYFIEKTQIREEIKETLAKTDIDKTAELNNSSKKIRELIESTAFPKELETQILEAYEILSADEKNSKTDAHEILAKKNAPFVAVRSSATTEDLADASFAGQQESFLNVRGEAELLEKTRKCMSSLFTARAVYYREKKGFKHENSLLAVVVQKMVNSKKSGVIFSANPVKNDNSIIIEAVFGLGEGIVSGKIKPDQYVVSPELDELKILAKEISDKKIAIIKNEDGKNETIKLPDETRKQQVLTNYEIKILAQHSKKLEQHYKKPQDIEFAIDDSGIYIVQSRPITTKHKDTEAVEISGKLLLSGLNASPGIASGIVKIIRQMSDLEKIHKGDVLVTEMTNPDMVVAMQKSAAIITDEGGITSHAAIVSREMGIPAVVGANDATKKLKDGDEVTVDGNSGKVYAGKGETKLIEIKPIVKGTKIKIKVIADLPESAERAAKSGATSIGLTRLEGIIALGGKHPLGFVKDKQMEKYTELLSSNLKKIVSHFEEIWIRSSDIRSDEFSNLEGAPKEKESNPMMGSHGIRFSLKHPEILKAEFRAVKEIAEHFPEKKVGLMVPLLISVSELQQTKKIAREINIPKNVKIGVMVETPAAVQIIEELCKEGIDFISFGTNDLTQFTLAVDRNNEDVQNIYDETNPAVIRSIQHVIRVCKKYSVETSICGQAGSKPEMAKILAEAGIDSLSANADAAQKISQVVAEIENIPQKIENLPQKNPAITPETMGIDELFQDTKKQFTSETLPSQTIFPNETADIEEIILKELEDGEDYISGDANGKTKQDIPQLNDAIPITSSLFDALDKEIEKEISAIDTIPKTKKIT